MTKIRLGSFKKQLAECNPCFVTFYHSNKLYTDHTSLFKSGWFKSDPAWQQPALSHDWDALCSIRVAFHEVIDPAHCRQYDVVIASEDPHLQRLLQVRTLTL